MWPRLSTVLFTKSPITRYSYLAAMYQTPCCGCTERTEGDRVAEPVDSAVSSPGAYLALGLLYTVAALPAIVAPQAVRAADTLTQAQGPFVTDIEVTATLFVDLSLTNILHKPHVPVLLDACSASDCVLVLMGVWFQAGMC